LSSSIEEIDRGIELRHVAALIEKARLSSATKE
jgi:hypothetical protein